MVTNDDLLANTTLSVSRLQAENAALRERIEQLEAVLRELVRLVKQDHTQDPDESGSCYGEYPCEYRNALDRADALLDAQQPEGKR